MKEVGMVIFRDNTDEVSLVLVEPVAFNEIKNLIDTDDFDADDMDNILEIVYENFLTTSGYPAVIERISTQTFCYDDIDWGKYKIKGLLTFPW